MAKPSVYDPKMCERLCLLMKSGCSVTEVAADLGVNKRTLYAWAKDPRKPDFTEAMELGKQLSEAWWCTQGRLGTVGALAKFNAVSWIYTMKCRFGGKWLHDNHQKLQVSRMETLSDADLDAAIEELVQVNLKKNGSENDAES